MQFLVPLNVMWGSLVSASLMWAFNTFVKAMLTDGYCLYFLGSRHHNFLQLSFLWYHYCHCFRSCWLLFLSLQYMLLNSLPANIGGRLCWLLLLELLWLQQARAASAEVFVLWAVQANSAQANSAIAILIVSSNAVHAQRTLSRPFNRLRSTLPELSDQVLLLLEYKHFAVQLSFELDVDDPQLMWLTSFYDMLLFQLLQLTLQQLNLLGLNFSVGFHADNLFFFSL
jgi:hypothetical protein